MIEPGINGDQQRGVGQGDNILRCRPEPARGARIVIDGQSSRLTRNGAFMRGLDSRRRFGEQQLQ